MSELLDAVKQTLRVKSTAYDDELESIIEAALADLGICDISDAVLTDMPPAAVVQAIRTYCRAHFGEVEADTYARLKASYDEQKAQLISSSKYTEWE